MNKKVILGLIVVIIVALGVGGYFILNGKNNEVSGDLSDKKVLVVYYSATGSTEMLRRRLLKN